MSRRIVTAREQLQMLSPWREAATGAEETDFAPYDGLWPL